MWAMPILPRRTNWRILLRRPWVLLRAYAWPLGILSIGALLDVLTTYKNVRQYGPEVEVHLVQRLVMSTLGPALGVFAAKAIQLFFVVAVATWWRPWCAPLLISCGLLYTAAAINNWWLIL